MVRKASRIATLRYTHSMECCGKTWKQIGPIPKKVRYICQTCRKDMIPTQVEVRALAACELIDDNRNQFNGEQCPDCERTTGHHVVEDGVCPGAYFLRCGSCGEELREVEPKELVT